MIIDQAFCVSVNHVLGQAAWARQRLAMFAGRTVEIELSGFCVHFRITSSGHVQPRTRDDIGRTADAQISIQADQLGKRILHGAAPGAGAVRLQGDAALAEAIGEVFRDLRWDYEEDLSHVVGDIVARRIATGTTAFHRATARSVRHLAEGTAEYLTEEAQWLVGQPSFERLDAEITALRDRISRLEKRTDRIARYRSTRSPGGRS